MIHRYSVNSAAPSGMEEAPDGMWVMHDDALVAVAAERGSWANVSKLAAEVAEWHVNDGDECGKTARALLDLLWLLEKRKAGC